MIQEYVWETDKLPYSIRILLESAIRNYDNFHLRLLKLLYKKITCP
ncbi:putative aconitate hydratase [Helianthus anomalus]